MLKCSEDVEDCRNEEHLAFFNIVLEREGRSVRFAYTHLEQMHSCAPVGKDCFLLH